MIRFLKELFGFGASDKWIKLRNQGAPIIDVRSIGEYANGHIPGSLNIPLDQLLHNLDRLPAKNQPIITCCASGIRSASAKAILRSNGFKEVYNGRGWMSLKNKLG